MESYFLRVKTFSRGNGSSATKAAAYRSGERIRDERSGAVFDYSDRTDVAHSEIIIPAAVADDPGMAWALNRSILWNAVQNSGRNWNARLAREVLVLLPTLLTRKQHTALVRAFAHELADRYGSAVDVAIHRPRPNADERHNHAHLLMTTRQVSPAGLGARTVLDLSGTERHARGLSPSRDDLMWIRERWAQIANEALQEAGIKDRIDHRSYKEQGINREPKPRMPQNVFYSERNSGQTTTVGDDIRARHRERLEARSKGEDELARVIDRQRRVGREQALRQAEDRKALRQSIPSGALTKEQLKEKRREYLRANAIEINRKQRERRRSNAEEVNQKQRERRLSNLEETRRKDRERYHERRAAEAKALGLQDTQKRRREMNSSINSPNRKAELSAHAPAAVTAGESVKNWLFFRASQAPVPGNDSVNRWLAYRQDQTKGEPTSDTARRDSRRPKVIGTDASDQVRTTIKPKRGPKNDMSL